jgi:hypothetical protein
MTADRIVISVCTVLAAALLFFAIRLLRRKRVLLSVPLIVVAGFLIGVIWFFLTFHMRLM